MRRNKVFQKIVSSILTLFTLVISVLVLLIVVPRLFQITPYAVISGSMEPNILVGDLVYAKKTDPHGIERGDVITFVMNEDLVVATHRVVEIHKQEESFITKGDANDNKDAQPVHFKNVLGTVRFTLPLMGFVVVALKNKYLILILVFLYLSLALLEKILKDESN